MMEDFRKFATGHLGINSMALNDIIRYHIKHIYLSIKHFCI